MGRAMEKVVWCDRDSNPLYRLVEESKLLAEAAVLLRHTKTDPSKQ
jgi:hypothetical protein